MNLVVGCASLQYSVGSLVLAIVSIVVSIFSIWRSHITAKRYASGNMEVVAKALDPKQLEKAAKILSKIPHGDCPVNPNLNLYQGDDYGEVWGIFLYLNMLAELISDDAIPNKINEDVRNYIGKYLSRNQVWTFVNSNKDMLRALYEIRAPKESCS